MGDTLKKTLLEALESNDGFKEAETEARNALAMADVTANVGDVTSTERGSGARYCYGKPPMSLLDLTVIALTMPDYYDIANPAAESPHDHGALQSVMWRLAAFQSERGHDSDSINNAITTLVSDDPAGKWAEAAEVMAHGAKKYAAWNWSKGMPWTVVLECAVRHALRALSGDMNDPETGLPHRAHLLCNLMFLSHYAADYQEGNDIQYGVVDSSLVETIEDEVFQVEPESPVLDDGVPMPEDPGYPDDEDEEPFDVKF